MSIVTNQRPVTVDYVARKADTVPFTKAERQYLGWFLGNVIAWEHPKVEGRTKRDLR